MTPTRMPPTINISMTTTEPPDPRTNLDELGGIVVHFDTGSAEPSPADRSRLERLALILADIPMPRCR